MLCMSYSKKIVLSTLISLVAALLFVTKPIFAQTPLPIPSTGQEQLGEQENENDFDRDVKQGKDELQKDPEAQRHQNEVVDGEDGMAGDEEDDDINEHATIQEAEDAQGENEENEDINNSEVKEVDDTDNLDEQSQEIINEHQVQEEGEMENEQQGKKETSEQKTSSQEGTSGTEQSQPEEQNSNQ